MTIEQILNESVKKTWNLFKKQYVALILGTLITVVLGCVIITLPPLIFGLYMMCLEVMKGKTVKAGDVFKGFDHFFLSLGIFIIGFIGITIGLIAFVIPGLLFMVMIIYTIAIAMTEKTGVIGSFQRSWDIAKKNFPLTVMLVLIILAVGALLSFTGIGILIALPLKTLLTCIIAEKIKGKPAKN